MKKFTRKFYNKKLVALGLSAFMGIGLISTGFAAWVMSKDANTTPTGNVNVAVVTDASAKIDLSGSAVQDGNVWNLNDPLRFDADRKDKEGRMSFNGGDNEGEDLTVTIKGVLTSDVPYELKAKLTLPASIVAAMEAGYIKWAQDAIDYTVETEVDLSQDEATKGAFEIVLSFAWGERFNYVNPCYYYDSAAAIDIDDAEMHAEMLEFVKVIYGLPETIDTFGELTEFKDTFSILLTASPTTSGETVSE